MNSTKRYLGWTPCIISVRGTDHREHDMMCQDQTYFAQSGSRQTIALIDGVGQTDRNAQVGKKLVKALAEFLQENFSDLQKCDKYDGGMALFRKLYDEVGRAREENNDEQSGIPISEYNYTLQAIAVDHAEGRYVSIHLGDGAIIGLGNRERILSYPFNGATEEETCFFMSDPALGKLKIDKGSLQGLNGVGLCSDGVYGDRENVRASIEIAKAIQNGEMLEEKRDDRSIILLSGLI